ncbi:MAG: hypothetical protein KF799_03975 [Bdellovibrionales bacterium]|nr:hypothetical protein [Bdellovibrionales bacterium]
MKRLLCTLLFASLPVVGQTATPSDYYRQLIGRWEGPELSYLVTRSQVLVKGEECDNGKPRLCGVIDQDYELENESMFRASSEYGAGPVEIVEISPTRLVKREMHPRLHDRAAVVTEELLDADTLKVVSELWDTASNQPRSRREYMLKRAPALTN